MRRVLFTVFITSILLLATGIGVGAGHPASALPGSSAGQAGFTIPYAGRLSDAAGQPVADGAYDLSFVLYGAAVDGDPLWTEVQQGVVVSAGEFLTYLGSVGVVPVKVSAENGPIRPGDLLVSSATPGYAMRAGPNPPQGTVLGKAMGKWDAGLGVITMLATLQ